ncbi:MAG: tetratricopeptide repeat protein [Bacilli bacterium]|nr:tetratricopeptide repeat protein [Bacilli bacterium]
MSKKYKVIVYAICKNESSFVERWYNSMKEADEIYVLDTGSTDDTVSKLESLGVHVETKIITPWRFDVARNESLKLVPEDADICVCTDLDEVFSPGWRSKLESSWNDSNRLRYLYNWSLDKNDVPLVSFLYEKIHDRTHYKWVYPVHEVLSCSLDDEKVVVDKSIVLNHYPDSNKSRSSYLPLLELSVKENPNNDRNLHYLGREYMYYGKWNECIDTLIKHINLETSTWSNERSASMRYISRAYINLGRLDEASYWLDRAIEECPNTREAYVEKAMLEYSKKNYFDVINNCIKAKSILTKDLIYTNEVFCWDSTIDDLLSLSYYNLGLKDEALFYIKKAIELNPNDERLKKNKEEFEK